MYTIILYFGSMSDIDRYSFWLQDFESAGLGKVLYPSALKEDVANGIARIVRGLDKWSMIIVNPDRDSNTLKCFLSKIKVAVEKEKNYFMRTPEKVWLVINKYSWQGILKPCDGISLMNLPANCRLLEYVVDLQNRERWSEALKLLCIVMLFAINPIPSENLVVYQRHRVDVEINVKEMWQYSRGYRGILSQGVEQAKYASAQIVEKIVNRDMEVLQDMPSAIPGAESTVQYEHKWRKERLERDKAYFDMKSSLKREKKFLAGEVKKREHYLRLMERELSKEDAAVVLEKKQREEVRIVEIMTDMCNAEQQLEIKRVNAEFKRSSAMLLCWERSEAVKMMGVAFLGVLAVFLLTLAEIGLIFDVSVSELVCFLVIALVFVLLIGIYLLLYNHFKKVVSKWTLKRISRRIKKFEIISKESIYQFALLCCRIRKKQTMLLGHGLAVRNKKERIEKARRHYEFCKKRLEKMKEWERFWRKSSLIESEEKDIDVVKVLNISEEPEREMAYNTISASDMQKIPINESGKTIECPFPFVKKLIVERDFR